MWGERYDVVPGKDHGEQVSRGFGFGEGALRQGDSEGAFDADDEFRATERVDSEIAIEPAVEGRRYRSA